MRTWFSHVPALAGRNVASDVFGARPLASSSDRAASPRRGAQVVPVQLGDHIERNLLRARHCALAGVRAAPETFGVVSLDHADHTVGPFRLPLRHFTQMCDLGADKKRGAAVRACGDTGSAPDA